MCDTQHHVPSTRLPEQFRRTQFRLILCALGTALLTLSTLVSNPGEAQKQGPKQPPAKHEQPADKGHALFAKNCSPCHGPNAQGGEGPNLHGLKLTDQIITRTIKDGIKSEMPSFGTRFKDAELRDLVAYLRSLKK
jgi:mono/diheme cytochrome c family protein